jgi:hypothetical protein
MEQREMEQKTVSAVPLRVQVSGAVGVNAVSGARVTSWAAGDESTGNRDDRWLRVAAEKTVHSPGAEVDPRRSNLGHYMLACSYLFQPARRVNLSQDKAK